MSNPAVMRFMRWKAGMLLTVILGLWSLMVARLYILQVKNASQLVARADRQHENTMHMEARRGRILDRNGNILALSVRVKSLSCIPGEVENIWSTARQLQEVLGIEKNKLIQKLTRQKKFAWLKRKLTDAETEAVMALDIRGLHFREEIKRSYPKNHLLSHVLGFVNIDNEGLSGLERTMEEYLAGTPGLCRIVRDGSGKELVAKRQVEKHPVDGMDVTLTIDEVIQNITEEEIDRTFEDHKAVGVMALVASVQTGDLLAVVNRPTFDLNAPGDFPTASRRNRSFVDAYEPGSIFKAISGVAVLNERVTHLMEPIFCEGGAYRLGGQTLHDAHPFDTLTFKEVVAKSSNIGFAKVVSRLQPETFYKYIRAFGFGTPYELPLAGQSPGLIRPYQKWSGYSMAALAMGHEIMVTPLQMTYAYATIANGGRRVLPRMLDRVENLETGESWIYPIKAGERIFSQRAANELTKALSQVVSEEGTAPKAAIKGYTVAGKTGTAQKVVNGRYSHSKHVASFIGFVPAENPVLVITVMVDEPGGKFRYGGSVAGPAFATIADRALRYLKVPFSPIQLELMTHEDQRYSA